MPQSRCKDTEAQKQIDRFVIKKSVAIFLTTLCSVMSEIDYS
jgi:hypothetical protein